MRTCPNCHSQINNPESSFCFECGSNIPLDLKKPEKIIDQKDTLVVQVTPSAVETPKSVNNSFDDIKTKKWNSFVLGSNAVSVLFVLFSVGVFFRTNYSKSSEIMGPIVAVNNVEISKEKLDIKLEEEVLKSNLYEVIPEDVIMYSESSNLNDFLRSLLSSEQRKYLEDSYELKFDDLMIFMRPNYAFVRKNNDSWAVITKTGGVDFFERTYAKYQENKTVNAEIVTSRIGEFLIISNDVEFVQQMGDVSNKISLGLKNNANFSKSLSSAKGFVVYFAYSPSQEYLATSLENDLKLFKLESLIDHIGKTEGFGLYVVKDSTGYSVSQIN